MRHFIVISMLLLFSGCTATLPPKSVISEQFSLLGVSSYRLSLTSEGVMLDPAFNKIFLNNYCTALESNIRIAMQSQAPEYKYINSQEAADLDIDVTLESLQGGNADLRFWIGLGAGATVSTAYVRVTKGKIQIAEGRITEMTTLVNIISGNYDNDQAVLQDVPRLARKIAEFVTSPSAKTANTTATIDPFSPAAGH